MAGLLPPVLIQYQLSTLQKVFELLSLTFNGEITARLGVDTFDPEKLAKVITEKHPVVGIKNGMVSMERLFEFAENVPDYINDAQYIGDIDVNKYKSIVEDFKKKVKFLTTYHLATISAIQKLITDFVKTIFTWITNSILNIFFLMLREVFWHVIYVINLVIAIWPIYINNCFATGAASIDFPGYKPHGPFEGAFIAAMMAFQLVLLFFELLYLLLRIVEYIIATILGIFYMIIFFVKRLMELLYQKIYIIIEYVEQLMGMVYTGVLPNIVTAGIKGAQAELRSLQSIYTANYLASNPTATVI